MGQFLTAEEVGEIMGYSASHSYSIISIYKGLSSPDWAE